LFEVGVSEEENMAKVNETWTVQEHGPLVELADGVLTVGGTIKMPLGNFPRRMTVVRTATGSLIYNAIALNEDEMRRIEAMGTPRFLVVPNARHRLDAKPWKIRYPGMKVIAPAGACAAVQEAVAVDTMYDIVNDSAVRVEPVDGTQAGEMALVIKREGDTTLAVADIIAHVAHPYGVGAQIMARLLGFGVSHPQVPAVAKMGLVKDKPALAAQFRRWAELPDLRRIVVGHGDVIERPHETLQTLADALS
jgi:hypothetical protein